MQISPGTKRIVGQILLLLIWILFLATPLYSVFHFTHDLHYAWAATLALLFGQLVGFSEIISRYRDEPLRATFNRYGLGYLLLNGILSECAFFVLWTFAKNIFPFVQGQPFLCAVMAGFGAMGVFRSKLFLFRGEDGKEYPIGPDIVLTSILRISDRKIDRFRAARRQQLIFERAKKIAQLMDSSEDFSNAANFLVVSMSSFQNLSDSEQKQVADQVTRIKTDLATAPNLYKSMVLGFALLNIVGEENFTDMAEDLEAYLADASKKPRPAA